MTQAYIVDYLRSPFTPAHRGALVGVRPDDLAASVIRALVARSGIDPAALEDVVLGCAFPEGEQGFNVARCAALTAGLPKTVGASSVNRWCGSSMQAVQMAAGAILMGAGDAIVAGGVESMTRVPMMGFNPSPNPRWSEGQRVAFMNMGLTAENLAERYKIDRETQDAYALESQRKALKRAGIAAGDLDVIEMNEAFAVQVLACCRDLDVDPNRLNRDGGAIALGHPLGATGARLVGKAASLLKRDGGRYGLATQCIGGGQGIAMVLEAA